MKIVSIVGARPQFIKLAPLSIVLRRHFKEVIIHTGQHYQVNMSDAFFKDLEIPIADYNLGVSSDNHGKQTANMLIEIEKVLLKETPEYVIVFGDTNSTLAGALAASKLHIPIIHIEAGLRSFNRTMPEEINRIVSDHISDYLFAPTNTAVSNLINEGLEERTFLTGDVMVDTLYSNLDKAIARSDLIKDIGVNASKYYLMTLHRPYNVDDHKKLLNLLTELTNLDKPIVFPVHPRTQNIVKKYSINISNNIKMIEPVGYLDFLCLQYNSQKIITDSGGIQKEAYLLGKPCITIRPETEWIETVEAGWNLLHNPDTPGLAEKINSFSPCTERADIFGRNVAEKMLKLIYKLVK